MIPSIQDNPVMGLAHNEIRAERQLQLAEHVYLCDFSEIRLAGVDLQKKTFFGCRFGARTFWNSNAEEATFHGCIFDSEPPGSFSTTSISDEELAQVVAALATLSQDDDAVTAATERYYRQVESLLAASSEIAEIAEVHVAFACITARAAVATPYYGLDLNCISDGSEQRVAQYLVQRLKSGDSEEKEAILRYLVRGELCAPRSLEHPIVPYLLRQASPAIKHWTKEFLLGIAGYSALEAALGPDLDDIARELLTESEQHPKSTSFRIFDRAPGLIPHDIATDLLENEHRDVRLAGLRRLWWDAITPTHPNVFLENDISEEARLQVLEWERAEREQFGEGFMVRRGEFAGQLRAKAAPTRATALRLLGFSGDPAFEPDARQALQDDDDEVRMYAVRALRWMSHVERDDPEILALKTDASERVREEVQAFATSTPPPSPPVKEPEPEPGFPLTIVDEAKLDMFALIETLRDVAGLRLDDATTVARELRLAGSAVLDVEADEIEAVAAALAKCGVALADVPQP